MYSNKYKYTYIFIVSSTQLVYTPKTTHNTVYRKHNRYATNTVYAEQKLDQRPDLLVFPLWLSHIHIQPKCFVFAYSKSRARIAYLSFVQSSQRLQQIAQITANAIQFLFFFSREKIQKRK